MLEFLTDSMLLKSPVVCVYVRNLAVEVGVSKSGRLVL